jgi:hypothetical protein
MQRGTARLVAFLLACGSLFGCGGGGGGTATSGGTAGGATSNAGIPFQSAAVSTATLVVDASQALSATGGDDVAAARTLFRSASYPESNGGLESTASLLDGIGTTFSRTINAEDGSYVDGSGGFHASDRLNWNLPWMKRYGYNAHVIVGQRQPAFIATPAPQWTADDWARYQDYATKLVRFVAVEFDGTGFPQTIFEVGNEVDITQDVRDLWTLANPAVPQGDESRLQHYLAIYAVWARAVATVAAENPGRAINIAGPALGGQSLFLTNSYWHERFANYVAANGLRLDIMTFHFYGDLLNGWANVPGSSLRAQLQRIRQALVVYNLGSVLIEVSEYGPSEGSDAVFGHINYSHESAAWGAMFLNEALAGTATLGSNLIVRDNFGANPTGSATVASLTHIENGVDYPKPIYNTFRMFTMLPGTRKAVTGTAQEPDVRGFASADGASAALIAYNYNYRFNWPSDYTDLTVPESVVPAFVNLPFGGTVSVERWLVDESTSNIEYYIDNGKPLDFNGTMLARVESCSATVSGGSLVLPARTLGTSGVSLWIVKSGAGAGLAACG